MNPIHIVVMVILCIFIIAKVRVPHGLHKFVGTVPGVILIMAVVFYLFTESPLLGVLGLIAGYELINVQQLPVYNVVENGLPNQLSFTPTNQFKPTLEETVVKTMVPMVKTPIPSHLQFKSSAADTHDASSLNV